MAVTGQVKWFNNEKVSVSSKFQAKTTYSYTSAIETDGFKSLEEGQKLASKSKT